MFVFYLPVDNITWCVRISVFNFLLYKFRSVSNVRSSQPTYRFSLKNICVKIYEIILYILIFINFLFKTGYAFERKLVSLFLCVLDTNFQTLLNNFIFLLLLCCGDIERNTQPKESIEISFCYCNLNSINVLDF